MHMLCTSTVYALFLRRPLPNRSTHTRGVQNNTGIYRSLGGLRLACKGKMDWTRDKNIP